MRVLMCFQKQGGLVLQLTLEYHLGYQYVQQWVVVAPGAADELQNLCL